MSLLISSPPRHVTKIFLNSNFTFFLEKLWKYSDFKQILQITHALNFQKLIVAPSESSFWLTSFFATIPLQTKTKSCASSLTIQGGAQTWEILSVKQYKYKTLIWTSQKDSQTALNSNGAKNYLDYNSRNIKATTKKCSGLSKQTCMFHA